MEPITLAVIAIGAAATWAVKVAISNYNTAQKLGKLIGDHAEFVDATYEPHGNDKQMALACTNSLNKNFGNKDILSNWNAMSINERKQMMTTLTREAATIMGVSVNNIVFNDSTTNLGSYQSDGTIYFSESFLACDCRGEMIRTIYHELKHATQIAAIQIGTENPYNYDGLTLAVWVKDNLRYEDGNRDFLYYYGQQIEIDARGFAKTVFP